MMRKGDIEGLINAHEMFLAMGTNGRTWETLSDSEVRLAVGYELDGVTYNLVKMGNRLTGLDLVAADKEGFQELKRQCFLIGRQIASISTEDKTGEIMCPIHM